MKDRGKKFSLSERLGSFRYAFKGILDLVRFEHNFRIHLIILTAVILAGIFFRISVTEWLVILVVSALVLVSEGFNSAIEFMSDTITDGMDYKIRSAKDIAAAAVLISVLTAVIAGFVIFIPELMKLLD
jgi:diacylglycerol kinase (ATP)